MASKENCMVDSCMRTDSSCCDPSHMDWPTSQIKRHRNMVRYWNRLIKMNGNRLTNRLFICDISKCNINWSSEIKCILNTTDHK